MFISLQCPSQAEIQKLLWKKQGIGDDCTEDWPSGNEALWEAGEADQSTEDGGPTDYTKNYPTGINTPLEGNWKVVNWIKHPDSPPSLPHSPMESNRPISCEPRRGNKLNEDQNKHDNLVTAQEPQNISSNLQNIS